MMRAVFLSMMGIAIGFPVSCPLGAAEIKTPRETPAAADSKAKLGTKEASREAAPATPAGKKTETAVFAGGCFWCMEYAFEQLDGVIDVESGYCGGTKATANYNKVHTGTTGHAEAIRVTYNPETVTYDQLLNAFFDSHNPTILNGHGTEDVGRQYRSAIFYANDEQKKQADAKIADLDAKRVHKRHIVTKLEPLKEFYPAEDYHQDFARRNPLLPYIQSHAVPKAFQLRSKHPELIRKGD
jgi:methionine-S-sulfoxide reductase